MKEKKREKAEATQVKKYSSLIKSSISHGGAHFL
jgi:hypothetical protein